MALTRTSVGNMALGHLTSGEILDIDSKDDPQAVKLVRWFEPSLRQMGRRHWNCLGALADLSRDVTNPEFGHRYRYELPNDCMLVRKVNGYLIHSQWPGRSGYGYDFGDTEYRESSFQIFGRFIHTDAEECKIEYTSYVKETSELDGMFLAAYALLIASNAAKSILNAGAIQEKMTLMALYKEALIEAQIADGNERSIGPADPTINSRFLRNRRVGTYYRVPYGS
jgi:hypothetical protein